MPELWDLLDKDRLPTGRTHPRGKKMMDGDYHTVVHVCIFNSQGEMLIQKRQPFKEGWPGLWDLSVGGSAVSGDDSQKAAERETSEELGLKINLDGIRPSLTINFDTGFNDIYLLEMDLNLDDLILQYEEVEKTTWASKEKILSMMEKGSFIPYHRSLISLLFEMLGKCGAIDES